MEKSDMMYYVAWITVFILLGLWIVIWALEVVNLGEMFLMWLLSDGILMIVLGIIRTREAPRGSNVLLATGMLVSILMLMALAVMSDIVGGWVGAGIGMILIGVVGLIILFRNLK
ncbi:MAG: hypothetical protein AYK23_01675 [Candidatus Proteinoplasmatales archaeon SG8-5]|nr:MAG: hypothetical protein AYK23_01675 [Candidatus Proteinoplasmatales archaeon SG8-5]